MQNIRISEAKELFKEGRNLKKECRFDEAIICFRQALEIEPNYPACLNNLGNLLQKKSDFDGAISCFKNAINIDPNLAVAFCNLASALLQIEDVAGAKANYEQALRLKPDFFIAHHNLGKLFVKEGNLENAEVCFKEALRLQPNSADVYFDLGNLRQQQKRSREAIEFYRCCVRHRPDHVEAYANLGAALQAQGALDLANFCLQRALTLDPNHAVANFNLGLLLETQHKREEALAKYEKTLSLKPEWTQVYYNLMRLWLSLGNWNDYEGRVQELIRRTEEHLKTENAAGLTPLILSYFRVPLSLHREVASRWAAQAVRSIRGRDGFREDICEKQSSLVNPPLRIGYISPDFRNHPMGILIYEMFQFHDRTKFQVYAYTLVSVRDDYTITIECGCDVFRDISEMSTEAAAAQIKADEIDILIDLGGYTTHTRPEILALQPAPIQCSYLGYPDTMGADFI
ncbi:tetratricopeptide repeat protein [Ancylothrix sp. C2]|uniref:tetratricopeptide repeat protein n=1 Tax=Ancylothrix sp. D3o TaxID=2953691 RepID=UPI0021BA7CB4|nr:tetratricopeptide repeat protein [Ancylothrix sp. D3o]MCT7951106.1 tetratricopeptide repeat protein [Ancylothrix sp. D3o]